MFTRTDKVRFIALAGLAIVFCVCVFLMPENKNVYLLCAQVTMVVACLHGFYIVIRELKKEKP